MLRSTNPCEESQVAELPMPPNFVECLRSCKCRHCGKFSVMNKVEDTESNRALAFIVEPSVLTIWTWHVVSTTGWWSPKSEWCVTVPGICFEDETHFICFQATLSMWSQVPWGFWHLRHFWLQGHCLTKCRGFKQLIQWPCYLRIAIICPCGNDLNFCKVYKGCLPVS